MAARNGTGAVPSQRSRTTSHSPQSAASREQVERRVERAWASTLDKHSVSVTLPEGMGTLRLPEPRRLVYYGGLAALGLFGVLDWPVVMAVGIGHLLAEQHHHQCLHDFGEALAEA